MKKIITIVFCICMIIVTAACGSAEKNTDSTTQEESQDKEDEEESTEEPVAEEQTEEEREQTEEAELPPTMNDLRGDGVTGEVNGVVGEMWTAHEVTWDQEAIAYRFTNTSSKDLIVALEYTGYDKGGYPVAWGMGSTMYLRAGESGVDYVYNLGDEIYFFEALFYTQDADETIIEEFSYISTEEYVSDGKVYYTITFPPSGIANFKYVIAYTDAEGRIIACDSLNGGTSPEAGHTWEDSFEAPEEYYENYETSLHDEGL